MKLSIRVLRHIYIHKYTSIIFYADIYIYLHRCQEKHNKNLTNCSNLHQSTKTHTYTHIYSPVCYPPPCVLSKVFTLIFGNQVWYEPSHTEASPPLNLPNAVDHCKATTNYKEAFALFDKRGNQRVPVSSLGDLLRACGQNPTLAEVDELSRGIKNDCKPFHIALVGWHKHNCFFLVDFDSFLKILNRPNGFRDPGEPEEFVRGFQVFDKEMTGLIGVGELKYGE